MEMTRPVNKNASKIESQESFNTHLLSVTSNALPDKYNFKYNSILTVNLH